MKPQRAFVRVCPLTALPGAVEQVERPLDPFPVLQVEEGVGDGLAVTSLQNVFWRKNQTLHLQQILRRRRKGTKTDSGHSYVAAVSRSLIQNMNCMYA